MKGTYVALFLCITAYAYNRKSVSFVMPKIIEEGMDASHAGLVITCQNTAFAISKFVVGVLSDRCNPGLLFVSGLLVSGLSTLIYSQSSSVAVFCILWFINGFAQGANWPPCVKVVQQRSSPSHFGTVCSMLLSGWNLSGCLSPILSAYIVSIYGWRTSVFIAGLTSVAVCLLGMLAVQWPAADSDPSDCDKTVTQESSTTISSFTEFTELLKDPFLWLVSTGYLVISCYHTTLVDWGQLFLIAERGRTQKEGSFFISSLEVGGFLGAIFTGYLTDVFILYRTRTANPKQRVTGANSRLHVLVIFMIAVVIFLSLLHTTIKEHSSLIWIVCLGFMLGIFVYGSDAIIGVVSSECAPAHLSGSTLAISSLAGNVGAMITGFPFCYIAKRYSWSVVLVILEVTTCAMLCVIIGCKNLQPKHLRDEV